MDRADDTAAKPETQTSETQKQTRDDPETIREQLGTQTARSKDGRQTESQRGRSAAADDGGDAHNRQWPSIELFHCLAVWRRSAEQRVLPRGWVPNVAAKGSRTSTVAAGRRCSTDNAAMVGQIAASILIAVEIEG